MIKIAKEVRRIAVTLTVIERLRLSKQITKEQFREELNICIDDLFNLSEEVDNEKTKTD